MELNKNDVNDKGEPHLRPNDSTTITDRSTHDITEPHDAVAGPIEPLEPVNTHSMEEQSLETCPREEDISDNTSKHGNITTDTNEDDRVNAADSASTSVSDSRVSSEVIVEPETCRESMEISDNTENMVDNQQQFLVVHSENTSDSQTLQMYSPTLLTQVGFEPDNYLRGCKWSVDGTKVLTATNENKFYVYNFPQDVDTQSNVSEMRHSRVISETGGVYDYCWYNQTSDPSSCTFLTTSKDNPIHNWDAKTGQLLSSYRAYDQMDELTAAYSLCYSLDGTKIYSGFKKMIRVFDTNRPGRECQSRPTFAGKVGGQGGIISCLAPSPQGNLYAAGSYSRSIGLYYEPQGEAVFVFEGQQGGVTHIAFSPDGTKLFSGGRKDPEILCWDLRKPGQILYVAVRKVETNQRIYFDLDSTGRYLFSGNHDGMVTVWDTQQPPVKLRPDTDFVLESFQEFRAHNDTVNGISLHPTQPVLATSSGQRHVPSLDDDEDLPSDTDSDQENSLKLWLCK